MPTIEEILRAAKEAGASDVHLTVGIPPKMRVNGNLITMDYPRMLPADTLEVLVNIMTEVQRERFEERGEYDMSFSIPNCGRYRVNAYKQRGSVALAFRLVGTVVPSPEELGVPESVVELYQRKRGLVLVTGPTGSGKSTTLAAIIDKINNVGFWDSIPLWAVTLLGGLFITVLSFIMILTVYNRMFKLYMYTAIAPIPMSTFAGETTSNVGKNFLRSYAGVCLEGAIIALACIIFSVMEASPPAVDPNVSAVTAVWSYVGELIFNLLVLVGAVRMSDRIVKELLGL